MIDVFLKLIQQVIDLLKAEKLSREQFFKQIIEPIFIDLQPVVDDYFALFLRAKHLFESGKPDDMQLAVIELREARESLLVVRIKVREMAEVTRKNYNEKKVNSFATNILRFFYSSEVEEIFSKRHKRRSRSAELIDLFDYVARNEISSRHLINYINFTLRNLEERWAAISQSYATLRIYYLSPIYARKNVNETKKEDKLNG